MKIPPPALLLFVVLVSCRSAATAPALADNPPPDVELAPAATTTPAPSPSIAPLSPNYRTEDERNTIAVFREGAPTTVFVTQRRVVVDYLQGTAEEVPVGSGSGFVWDRAGHVVTNYHVVENAPSITVTFQNQQTFAATAIRNRRGYT